MTTKEIALAVGKEERTVQRWVKRLADKMPSINDKMSSSSPMRPADYNLTETLQIVEEGMGKNAAGIFRANANTQRKGEHTDVQYGMELVFGAIGKLAKRVDMLEEKVEAVPQIGYDETHMTVLGFCKVNDITCSVYDASRAGKEAARLSREEGIEIRTVPDDRFGKVNSYHKAILSRVFAL